MRSLLYLLFITLVTGVTFSCSKEEVPECTPPGGVSDNHDFVFWMRTDPKCGTCVRVDLYREGQQNRFPATGGFNQICLFMETNRCSGTNTSYAYYRLPQGFNFRYEAYCGTKTWSGTFKVPCVPNGCTAFEIK
jgi:hypothetical protein